MFIANKCINIQQNEKNHLLNLTIPDHFIPDYFILNHSNLDYFIPINTAILINKIYLQTYFLILLEKIFN